MSGSSIYSQNSLSSVPPEDRGSGPGAVFRLGLESRHWIEGRARESYPHEGCGLLVGSSEPGPQVEYATAARNLAHDRLTDRYRLDPEDFLAVDAQAREDGHEILGIWHSHPDHPAKPSPTDRAQAWPGYTYVIVEVREGAVRDLTAWHLEGDRFVQQDIQEDI